MVSPLWCIYCPACTVHQFVNNLLLFYYRRTSSVYTCYTAKPVWRGHCHEKACVLKQKGHTALAEGPTGTIKYK